MTKDSNNQDSVAALFNLIVFAPKMVAAASEKINSELKAQKAEVQSFAQLNLLRLLGEDRNYTRALLNTENPGMGVNFALDKFHEAGLIQRDKNPGVREVGLSLTAKGEKALTQADQIVNEVMSGLLTRLHRESAIDMNAIEVACKAAQAIEGALRRL